MQTLLLRNLVFSSLKYGTRWALTGQRRLEEGGQGGDAATCMC